MNEQVIQKLKILTESAKYDVYDVFIIIKQYLNVKSYSFFSFLKFPSK